MALTSLLDFGHILALSHGVCQLLTLNRILKASNSRKSNIDMYVILPKFSLVRNSVFNQKWTKSFVLGFQLDAPSVFSRLSCSSVI